ncbi:MAG: hypothetical protein AABX72_00170 [Nanoarchaeota archaeon]
MITKEYMDPQIVEDLKQVFQKEGSVQLRNFLDKTWYTKMLDRVKRLRYEHVCEPLYHSYHSTIFSDKRFLLPLHTFACTLMGVSFQPREAYAFSFHHKDYTLLHDEMQEEDGTLVIFDLTPWWNQEAGGFISFIQDNQEALRVLSAQNTFTMIRTTPEMKRFIKYVNVLADKNKRYFLELRYP